MEMDSYLQATDDGDEEAKERMLQILEQSSEKSTFGSLQLKESINTLKKAILKNETQRTKYPDDPRQFMESELQLDEAIQHLKILSEHTELYSQFANSGIMPSIISLLRHENVDIVLDAVDLLQSLFTELDFTALREDPESTDLLNIAV